MFSSDTKVLGIADPVQLQEELTEAQAINVRQMLFQNL
jgi:hypothetical protein